jgi:Quercetinase C-terminal cupin domain
LGSDGALTIYQDAAIFAAEIGDGDKITYNIRPGRRLWLRIVRGIVCSTVMNCVKATARGSKTNSASNSTQLIVANFPFLTLN